MFAATPPTAIAESARRVRACIAAFEQRLARSDWLGGDAFSLADFCVFATFYGLPLSYPDEVNFQRTPHLRDWLARCHARPACSVPSPTAAAS
jgi:glutathione S-transferase/GST-like protein